MNNTTKTILAACAGMATVGGAFTALASMTPTAKNLLDSGPLPLASREEVAAVTTTLQQIQGQLARQGAQDTTRDKELAVVRQQQLETLLAGARADYAKSPTSSGRIYLCTLINQVDVIRIANRLPVIPPC